MEAIRLKQPFEVWAPVHVRGKPGDWLVHMDGGLHIFTDTRFKELYKPTTISALEAELDLLRPLPVRVPLTFRGGYRPTQETIDKSNPPSSFTAVTPPTYMAQPMPLPGARPVEPFAREVFEKVAEHQRNKGLKKYGTPLEAFNGRDPVMDLLGELYDAWMYACQILLEQTIKEEQGDDDDAK